MSDKISILLVEDSPMDAELTLEHLAEGGISYVAERVETREGFIGAIRRRCPEIILCDYALPGFDGRTALELARVECPDVPFLFVSGVIGEEFATESLKQGATDYVLKHRLERLAPAVRRALGEAGERVRLRKVEEALRESEERFRSLADHAPVMVWVTDPDGSCTYLSRSWYEFSGQTPETGLGFGWLNAVHLGDREETRRVFEEANQRHEPFRVEYRLRRRDGQWRWAIDAAAPRFGGDGSFMGFVGSVIDISERKRAEDEVRSRNSELQQFAFAVAHDLQEPLRTMQSYTQLLARRMGPRLEADERVFMGFLMEAASHLGDLMRDLREYLDVAGATEHDRRPVYLDKAAQKAIGNLEVAIEESGAQVTLTSLPVVTGKEVHYVQLLQNLLSNAIKYRRDGAPPEVLISSERRNGEWIVSVQDNGIGIPAEYSERVFGLFKRLHGKTVPGTGMGLAICQKVAERYGGRIWVDSQPGQGSTFHVAIPAERGTEFD